MDILKASTGWAKAEIFSTSFFIFFGLLFVLVSVAFWQLGKTDLAKAYVIPTLVAGVLLVIIGVGLSYTNIQRVTEFEAAYQNDISAFIASELSRVEATLNEYKTIVFKAIPLIIAACALMIIFMSAPVWRASMITTIAMMSVILLIDGTAHARIEVYYEQLITFRDAALVGKS
jgi:hypothetical protein